MEKRMRRRIFLGRPDGKRRLRRIHRVRLEVTKTDAEWKKMLSPAAYDVLRHEGTEAPYTSPLNKEHRKGIFACAGCGLDLYSSDTKFEKRDRLAQFLESRCRTPMGTSTDRQHVHGAHRGALPPLRRRISAMFSRTGPPPTGLRYLHERRRPDV